MRAGFNAVLSLSHQSGHDRPIHTSLTAPLAPRTRSKKGERLRTSRAPHEEGVCLHVSRCRRTSGKQWTVTVNAGDFHLFNNIHPLTAQHNSIRILIRFEHHLSHWCLSRVTWDVESHNPGRGPIRWGAPSHSPPCTHTVDTEPSGSRNNCGQSGEVCPTTESNERTHSDTLGGDSVVNPL